MTTTPPEAPAPPPPAGEPGPRGTGDQVRDLGRLRRSRIDRKVAGVAGGLARHLNVDPLILRVAFVVLVFFGGAGLILYGACWLLLPEEGAERAPFHLDERTRSIALIVVGAVAALATLGDSWGTFWFPWPVTIVALVTLWLLTRNNQSSAQPPVAQPYAPPAHHTPSPGYLSPANPRKRGSTLFWFTLALVALALGVLGIVDLAGASVATSAYPALAVGICGVVLVVGAFFGRAGGLIALGLVSAIMLAVISVANNWEGDSIRERPTTAVLVQDRYWLGAGEQVIDLTRVADLDSLDGRSVEIEGGVGRIEVIVPDGIAATVMADIDGPGRIDLLGEEDRGLDIRQTTFTGSFSGPVMTIDAHLGVGEIEVSHR